MNSLLLAATLFLASPDLGTGRDTPSIPASGPETRPPNPLGTMRVGEHVPLGEEVFDLKEATFMTSPLGAMAHQPHKKLKVAVHSTAFRWISDVIQAITFWNATANRELFVLMTDFPERKGVTVDTVLVLVASDEVINVVLDGIVPPGAQAAATRLSMNTITGELANTVVLFPFQRFEDTATTTARHEFGHVLGLDHDTNEDSLMAVWSGGKSILSFTDFMAIRLVYGQE